MVKPQHFLPVHGEYAFLCRHAELAQDLGVQDTSVIRNGQLLGVYDKRNAKTVSIGACGAGQRVVLVLVGFCVVIVLLCVMSMVVCVGWVC